MTEEEKAELEMLSKRVASVEKTLKAVLDIIKKQNEVVQKLSVAVAAVVKKMTVEFAKEDKKDVENE